MLNVQDVEDAILIARSRFNKMQTDIVAEYMRPYNELAKALLMRSMEPGLKEELTKKSPKAMEELDKRFKEGE